MRLNGKVEDLLTCRFSTNSLMGSSGGNRGSGSSGGGSGSNPRPAEPDLEELRRQVREEEEKVRGLERKLAVAELSRRLDEARRQVKELEARLRKLRASGK